MDSLPLTRDNLHLSGLNKASDRTPDASLSKVERFISDSIAPNTRKAYQSDLAHFLGWGGTLPATADMVASYLAHHADTLAPASLSRRIATLSKVHEANDWPNPCSRQKVRATLRGIKRTVGTSQKQAKPLLREDLFLTLDALGTSVRDIRDRALILIGWAGGFRCSELTGLDLSDVVEVREGLLLQIRRSKTDQTGEGRTIGIPLGRTRHCPVAAFTAWRDAMAPSKGPVFRPMDRHGNIQADRLCGDSVSTILREHLAKAGLNPSGFSGHSLRAGLATSAAKAGVPTHKIRAQTGHASDATRRAAMQTLLPFPSVVQFMLAVAAFLAWWADCGRSLCSKSATALGAKVVKLCAELRKFSARVGGLLANRSSCTE